MSRWSNFEARFPFTKQVVEEIEETMYQQDLKGFAKYNQALDPMDEKYDWLVMAEEELADLTKYFKAEQHKRNMVLEKVFSILEDIHQEAQATNDTSIMDNVQNARYYLGILIPSEYK